MHPHRFVDAERSERKEQHRHDDDAAADPQQPRDEARGDARREQ